MKRKLYATSYSETRESRTKTKASQSKSSTVQAYSVYMHSEAVHISKCSKQGRQTAPDAKGPTVGTRSTGEEHIPSTSLKKGTHASPRRARPSKAAATEAFSLLLTHRHSNFARSQRNRRNSTPMSSRAKTSSKKWPRLRLH